MLALLAVAGIVALAKGETEDGTRTIVRRPLAFNVRYPDDMQRLAPADGQYLHLKRKDLDEFIVEPLALPAYKGDVSGILPVAASREMEALRKRFPALEPVEEGKTRINRVAGYSIVFRASRAPRLYGRVVLLPQAAPGALDGVKLVMLATPDAGADKARDVGTRGELKTPYRSFRFGTEGP